MFALPVNGQIVHRVKPAEDFGHKWPQILSLAMAQRRGTTAKNSP